jgi:hypothetical protein
MSEYDPKSLRPRRDWCSVLMEERKAQLASGLFLPGSETGVEKVTEGVAVIVRVGPGDVNEKLGLEPGMRVCLRSYFKHANPIPTEQTWPSGAKKEFFFVSTQDIQATVPAGTEVGVFSSPAQSGKAA